MSCELLFFGDVVGKPGRKAVTQWLAANPQPLHTVIIANIENATHGYGFSLSHYDDLRSAGVHFFTSGNHILDHKDAGKLLSSTQDVLRPANFPKEAPGKGYALVPLPNGNSLGVINLIGQVFMGSYNSPWEALDAHIAYLQQHTRMIFIDFHAETTAEKAAMAHYVSSLERPASVLVGTHTHVQTADERILRNHTGFITDVGFNGAHESVIGMRAEASIARMRSHAHQRMEVPESANVQINAVRVVLDETTGACQSITRINTCLQLT